MGTYAVRDRSSTTGVNDPENPDTAIDMTDRDDPSRIGRTFINALYLILSTSPAARNCWSMFAPISPIRFFSVAASCAFASACSIPVG